MTKISVDQTVNYLKEKASTREIKTAWDRYENQRPQCKFGQEGVCCRICGMGPCRISKKAEEGVCGANADTIAARNFCRMIAAGTAAHSDHGREIARTLIATAQGKAPGYEVRDEKKLLFIARIFGVETEGKSKEKIAEEVGKIALAEFGKPEGNLFFTTRAPQKRQTLWQKWGMTPRAIDREVVELMHRTNMGTDQEIENLLLQGSRCALADGWGGSMIATELQDILFGTPNPKRSKVNLGVLKEDQANIIVHGHEPLLSEMIVKVAQEEEMIKLAQEKGAKGINIVGICCTANEVLMRHGIPLAGNFLQQELALITGAVEAMVVDVQCIMQSLPSIANCYHTEIISTSSKAKIPGAIHMEFNEHNALENARSIIKKALDNFPKRGEIDIPKEEMDLVAGFSHETINYMLGGKFRASYRPLNDNIINGRILGVVGVVGCNNPKIRHDYIHTELVKELIANNILVVQSGCSAMACAKQGLLIPEAAQWAGEGLAEVCEAVGIPPVLHCGSCVDNSRILIATSAMVAEGGLGTDISDLPVAGVAPEWMSEKAIAIGQYFVASGVFTVFGGGLPVEGAEKFADLLFRKYETITKGKWGRAREPKEMVGMIVDHIRKKRVALGIDKAKERVLYDMEMRRKLEV